MSVAWAQLGFSLRLFERYPEAVRAYRRALRQCPHGTWWMMELANVYNDVGRHRMAIRYFRKALRREPSMEEALTGLGFAYWRADEGEVAIDVLESALALYPGNNWAWCVLGDAYYFEGYYPEAVRAYRRAAELEPSALNLRGLASALEKRGEFGAAAEARIRAEQAAAREAEASAASHRQRAK